MLFVTTFQTRSVLSITMPKLLYCGLKKGHPTISLAINLIDILSTNLTCFSESIVRWHVKSLPQDHFLVSKIFFLLLLTNQIINLFLFSRWNLQKKLNSVIGRKKNSFVVAAVGSFWDKFEQQQKKYCRDNFLSLDEKNITNELRYFFPIRHVIDSKF